MRTVLTNARVFDGYSEDCEEGVSVLIEDNLIREVSARPIAAGDATVIDVVGKTLMPGLIDLHTHAYNADITLPKNDIMGDAYRTAHAVRMLGHAIDSGFTTIRDIGGGDWSLSRAIADKLIHAPRWFYAGKVLSMTGGHGDWRQMGESQHTAGYCSCGSMNSCCVVVDGVDECIKAAREELRRGAHCLKITASGGIASPTDPIWMNQFREDEIRAIVNECKERRTYVAAHCHPADAIRRCVEFGVRSIEHGILIDRSTADFVAERGAYVIPTMVFLFVLTEQGEQMGFPEQSLDKARYAYRQAVEGLDHMRSAGVKLGFGTDLLGDTYVQQSREFTIRREVFSPIEILRQATSTSAEVLMHEGRLGCVREGAYADLIVVDGDPIADLDLLAAGGRHLDLIMRDGEIVKYRL
jgi:imidazolonepropionase-like amidohydrolase